MLLGFELMIMGMGTVFTFLILLIFCMTLMSRLVAIFEAERAEVDIAESEANKILPDKTLIAIISAAIHQHRNRN